MESGKIVLMILLAGQQRGQRHFGHSESVRQWDDLGEQHWNVILPYVKWIASVDSMYDPGNPKPVLCDTQSVGWGGEWRVGFKREGTYVYLMPIHVDVCQKPSQYCKLIILQFKKFILPSLLLIIYENLT